MTAYGAVISLKNTIHHILHSTYYSLVEPSPTIIQLAYNEVQLLQEILKRLDETRTSWSRKKVNALDGRIKHKIWELEDSLESLLSQQILSQFDSLNGDPLLFSIDLHCLQDDVASFIHALKEMETDYIYELENMAEDDDEELHESLEALQSVTSRIPDISSITGGSKSKMIGLSDQFQQIKRNLRRDVFGKHLSALVGMAGVGKTTLAKKIFQDPQILRYFDCRAWGTVGRKPQMISEISQGIVAQLCGIKLVEGDGIIGEKLKGKKCLIVLDDVWEAKVLDSLMSSLPEVKNGYAQILLTARDQGVIGSVVNTDCHVDVVRFLNEEESMELLCVKVFGGKELCPSELHKAATKIAKKCEGLPLMIVTVADILSKSQNREAEYWNDVAEERNSVFRDAYNEISKVLFPSYDYLPQYLKMPFLYMGVFPHDYDTSPSKLISVLAAEGWFLHTNNVESLEENVWKCLVELCTYKNLVLFNKKSIFWHEKFHGRMYKTCRLHSTWRHVCRGEATKKKFYHVCNRLDDAGEEGVKGQRCLCLENNILFAISGFSDFVRLNCASSTRSLLFVGPYHQYPIPINVDFTLLRELDALKLRFYTFPTEILTLVQLKNLALTCNGEIPTTISKLFNLRVLIIHPHMSIRRCKAPSYVPTQIWDMKELEHIEILGKSLVAPSRVVSLEKLSTLIGVNASICTISKLSRRILYIRKLGVEIELTPYDDHNDLLSCFGCISALGSLETLKCSITNPVIKNDGYVDPSSFMLPRGLRKLHLSGMGFPWEYMDVIGSLPFLQVLKLRSYAFQGSKWGTQEGSFSRLEFLLIQDSDLMQWQPSSTSFPGLSYLSLKHCYKLKEIHWPSNLRYGKIELVNCNPLSLACANRLQLSRHILLDVNTSSTFEEKPMSIKFLSYTLAESEDSMFTSSVVRAEPEGSDTSFSSHFYIFSIIVLLGCFLKFM